MAKPSNKKVSRAARTTGGRTARGARPWGWYSALAVVVLLGSLGVWQSREDRLDKAAAQTETSPKRGEHWHAALGIYICNEFIGNIPDNGRDPHGIYTHGDGIVHIHPFDSSASGKNATLGVFFKTMNLGLGAAKVEVPGGKTWNDGEKCDGKSGEVQLFVNGTKRSGNPASYKMNDRDDLVLAFAPRGAEIPKIPPSHGTLDNLSDVGAQTPTTVPGEATGDTTPADPNATPTTAPPTSDTTATTAAP